MRIRSIKPDYWKDARLHNTPGITADVREFYIGCWGLADDAGYLRWDVSEIAGELYRYKTVRRREAWVTDWSARLTDIGRLIQLPCGHAYLPKLTKHQRLGGNRTEAVWREHQACVPGQVQTDMDGSVSSSTVGKGREGEGKEGKGANKPNLTSLATVLGPERMRRLEERVR